jgi:phosphoribosylaminoimidazole-succinocarboxamide synthase
MNARAAPAPAGPPRAPPDMYESSIQSLPLLGRGKVRDIYAVGDDRLLIVTTDRLSAYDVILPTPVPEKGRVLTELANFWFARLAGIVPNHLTGIDPESVVAPGERDQVRGRAIVAKRLQPLPIEAVVRGYLEGSGWQEYQQSGTVCGIALPPGLARASKLPQPIFTPATKAEAGHHDENIDFARTAAMLGADRAKEVRDTAIALYRAAADYALTRGIIIADTKFEFGLDPQGRLHLIDEALTPDSSRFWPQATWREGASPESFDKQYVRNWLDSIGFERKPPAPEMPPEVARRTSEKYQEALKRLAG